MKYTINSINQLGISEFGLSDKTDLIDWVMLDYIFDWQQNPKALSLNGMVWFSYRHFMNEMPIIGIKDKGAISKRVKKLKELDLISTFIDPDSSRIFVRTTEKYFDVTRFKTVDAKQPPLTEINPPVDLKQPPVDLKQPPVDLKQPPVDLKQPPVDLKQPNSNTNNSNTNNSDIKEQIEQPSKKRNGAKKPKALISQDWTPSDRCTDLLTDAGIPQSFWAGLIGEFIFYWEERQEMRAGWDSTFLAHAKRQWQSSSASRALTARPQQPKPVPQYIPKDQRKSVFGGDAIDSTATRL